MLASGHCLFSKILTCCQRDVIEGPICAQEMFSGMLLYVHGIKIVDRNGVFQLRNIFHTVKKETATH
jgi:hypothetical protein